MQDDLKTVIAILLKECPQYEDYIRVNFPKYFEE